MDIYRLLDLMERLLNLYGYETERDVGIVGGGANLTDLTQETAQGPGPAETREPLTYQVDILGEKRDIERPYGRVVVFYNRRDGPLEISDFTHAGTVLEAAMAYTGYYLTVTGAKEDAIAYAHNNGISIITPEKIEELIGKAMVDKPWWQSVNAYPIYLTYPEMIAKLKHTYQNWFHRNWKVSMIKAQELAYLPYWKCAYSIMQQEVDEEYDIQEFKQDSGMMAVNAYDGMMDQWWDYDPFKDTMRHGKGLVTTGLSIIDEIITSFPATPGKIEKPKDMPKEARFEVYKPALEKYEAKIAATQWIAYIYNVDPKTVTIHSLELVYLPWWRFRIDHMPYIRRPWNKTEWFTVKISAINGDVFDLWRLVGMQRNIVFYMAEKYLINLLGRRKMVRVMNWITYKVFCRFFFWYLGIKPSDNWIKVLFILLFSSMVYGMLVFKSGLMLLVFIGFLFLFIGPGYALLYVLQEYLEVYPWGTESKGNKIETPALFAKMAAKIPDSKTAEDGRAAKNLESMKKAGHLTQSQQKRLQKYWNKMAAKDVKAVKK